MKKKEIREWEELKDVKKDRNEKLKNTRMIRTRREKRRKDCGELRRREKRKTTLKQQKDIRRGITMRKITRKQIKKTRKIRKIQFGD